MAKRSKLKGVKKLRTVGHRPSRAKKSVKEKRILRIKYMKMNKCYTCLGTGGISIYVKKFGITQFKKCQRCKGTGEYRQ